MSVALLTNYAVTSSTCHFRDLLFEQATGFLQYEPVTSRPVGTRRDEQVNSLNKDLASSVAVYTQLLYHVLLRV